MWGWTYTLDSITPLNDWSACADTAVADSNAMVTRHGEPLPRTPSLAGLPSPFGGKGGPGDNQGLLMSGTRAMFLPQWEIN
jgi:hypothetical protein